MKVLSKLGQNINIHNFFIIVNKKYDIICHVTRWYEMNFMFCGIIDIVLVVLFVIFIFVGWKKGFVEKFLSLANTLCGFLFSLLFCRDFAGFLIKHNIFYGSIYDKVFTNVSNAEALQNGEATAAELLGALGFPNNLSEFIASKMDIDSTAIAAGISSGVTKCIMVILAFIIMFFGITIICFLLKLIFKALKEGSTVLKVTDGILGIVFYFVLFFVIVDVCLFGVSILMSTSSLEGVRNFIDVDMQLSTDKFRLSKYLYDHNALAGIIGILF